MWYYMIKYSFDPSKIIKGPFTTEEEAYEDMEDNAYNEYNICVDENDWETEIYEDAECGEITIVNYFGTDKDVTEYFIFKILTIQN